MILKFPKPWDMSRESYVLLASRNATAQDIPLDPGLKKELKTIIQKRLLKEAKNLNW